MRMDSRHSPTKLFCMTVMILLMACNSVAPSVPLASRAIADNERPTTLVNPTPPVNDDDPGINLLVDIEGSVLLKRPNWNDFYPITFGTLIYRGDLLKVPTEGRAKILCDNLRVWAVPAGPVPSGLNGCPRPQESLLNRPRGRIIPTRIISSSLPYIISPRLTKVLTSTPTLRWNATGSSSYTVLIRGENLNWSQENVTRTVFIYPGSPPLQPDIPYLLIVEDEHNQSSQNEGQRGLGFTMLAADGIREIQSSAERIAELRLSMEGEKLALAYFYASNDLIAEAIEILETLTMAEGQHAQVYQFLADLYTQIRLPSMAEPIYLEALTLAKQTNNLDVQSTIHAILGEKIYPALNNEDVALDHLKEAKAIYEILGDTEQVSKIDSLVNSFE